MEAGLGLGMITLIIVLAVWYFGSTINIAVDTVNSALTTGAKMAVRKLEIVDGQDEVTTAKQWDKLGKEVKDLKLEHSKDSVKLMLGAIGVSNVQ